jgi:hypothetical protein
MNERPVQRLRWKERKKRLPSEYFREPSKYSCFGIFRRLRTDPIVPGMFFVLSCFDNDKHSAWLRRRICVLLEALPASNVSKSCGQKCHGDATQIRLKL